MKERICVIPARGGSQRVKNKNIRVVEGKPLLAHGIEVARASDLFEQIVVSSQDDGILQVAEDFGAVPHRRPSELATDEVLVIQVVREVLDSHGVSDDAMVGIMLPTSPLRTPEDLRRAYRLFEDNCRQSPVVSVAPYERPIQLGLRLDADNRLRPLFYDEYVGNTRTEGHTTTYWYNGAIIFNTAGTLRRQGRVLIGQDPVPYIMPYERSIDIDHEFQIDLVQSLLKRRQQGGTRDEAV